jgi:dedicator of cytokinesis protein 1
MWECALEVCDELRQQYEESFSYSKLPKLHRQMASFYDKILDKVRYEPEYFRVAFYGLGFPTFLQDKVRTVSNYAYTTCYYFSFKEKSTLSTHF